MYRGVTFGSQVLDADLFYFDRRDGHTNASSSHNSDNRNFQGPESWFNDKNTEYIPISRIHHHRSNPNIFSARSKRIQLLKDLGILVDKSYHKQQAAFPSNSQSAYLNWERSDVKNSKKMLTKPPNRVEFNTRLNAVDPFTLLVKSLSTQYKDALTLRPNGLKKLYEVSTIRKYKNNLTAIIKDYKTNEEFLVVACNSEMMVFEFNSLNLPNDKPVIMFDTKPPFTTTTDRLISTWPYFPHTINFVKTFPDFKGDQPILCACVDDGTLIIWNTDTIINRIRNKKTTVSTTATATDKVHIKPQFKIKLEASLWGLDFKHYEGNHNVFMASDNSQSLTLLYYHESDLRFYHIKSHQLLHNIPEVGIISVTIDLQDNEELHTIKTSCASISGELLIFQFQFCLVDGPLNEIEYNFFKNQEYYYVDSSIELLENRNNINFNIQNLDTLNSERFNRLEYRNPFVLLRTVIGEYCWTSKLINSQYFKSVNSLNEVIGDFTFDSAIVVDDIMNESKILDLEFDPMLTSHLGLATNWQHFEAKTLNLSTLVHSTATLIPNSPPSRNDTSRLTSLDDEYRRVHKGLIKQFQKVNNRARTSSANKQSYLLDPVHDIQSQDFLVVSTGRRLGLFRADSLFCTCSTKKLFDLPIPSNNESKPANRISITHIIPELQCYIAVTQQGLITIMRLCQYRGVYGMRQEHIFPNAISLALDHFGGYRTIAGINVRDKSSSPGFPRFLLYIVYTDGLIVSYELSLDASAGDLLITSI
ncbi:CRT10-domain-containing protein [Scheffersomyces amazonensis]|uniref:CRT10-domain-containing protein n=1 Tax=Scheffersomyces amazonensis TaxID=1078765 RepID=UPI00315DB847